MYCSLSFFKTQWLVELIIDVMASLFRYEAALVLQKSCLTTVSVGEVLRILNMIITMKKWIKNAHPGWQPITVTLLETKDDDIGNDS